MQLLGVRGAVIVDEGPAVTLRLCDLSVTPQWRRPSGHAFRMIFGPPLREPSNNREISLQNLRDSLRDDPIPANDKVPHRRTRTTAANPDNGGVIARAKR
jgi:hypothetical protein